MRLWNILLNWKVFGKQSHGRLLTIILSISMIIGLFIGAEFNWNLLSGGSKIYGHVHGRRESSAEVLTHGKSLIAEHDETHQWGRNCSFWDCFNVYRCGRRDQNRMTIYVYPFKNYHLSDGSNQPISVVTKEYYHILETVTHSVYYTENPNEACLFLPSTDMLNGHLIPAELGGRVLTSLEYWDSGENHLIFNILPGNAPKFNKVLNASTDKAIIVGGNFESSNYRYGFDIAFPVWSPLLEKFSPFKLDPYLQRKYWLIAAQQYLLPEHRQIIKSLREDYPNKVLLLQSCNQKTVANRPTENKAVRCDIFRSTRHYYPSVLLKGRFCLFARSTSQAQPDFIEILAYNCIPIVAVDDIVLPFSDVIDWSLATIRIRESNLHSIIEKIRSISDYKILEMQKQLEWLFQRYFKDLTSITLTTLDILNERIFPHFAKTIMQWNKIDNKHKSAQNPLFQPIISLNSQGFTAVILTYDRVESLFTLIEKLSVVSCLQRILVIWNNQDKPPPQMSMFPKLLKPLKVIQTKANKLSNRFYPYDEIETEAVLTIDDDIIMLTADELNFGFEVWREFPDRIVGFPSRIHIWDNATRRWRYESEWTNQISMVLTGAAFHHKYWSYMYTNNMPLDIKDWVDDHMNCEDIAMNFLVANITNKAPIKVAPRKKFKCPECTNTEMLSAYVNHMMERSTCIDRFAQFYGHMPLRSVEFRADPVLYKDKFPDKLKRFNEIGSL